MNERIAAPTAVLGVGPEKVVIFMSKEEHEDNEDEDDWMKYANAGFGQTDYSLWDETEQPPTDDEDDSSLDQPQQLGTHMEEIPRAPSPAGHKHLVRIGTCATVLGV